MKNILFISLFFTCCLTSCKDDYYEETGVHESTYDGTIMDYLRDHPVHFSKLVEVIQHAEQQSVFTNQEITFFAPQNVSVDKMIHSTNLSLAREGRDTITNVTQIKPEVWKQFLDLYIIDKKFELKDIAQVDTVSFAFEGQSLVSHNGRIMNAGVIYHNANGVQYAGYRMVLYAYIRDFSATRTSRINVPVSSSNIKPHNGIVHVLRAKDHYFGFDPSVFIDAVMNGGLTE